MENTSEVCNLALGATCRLTQSTIANRMIEDGLPEKKEFSVKLFFCDESDNAKIRTDKFYQSLTDNSEQLDFSSVDLHYYPGVILTSPQPEASLRYQADKYHKKAFQNQDVIDLPPEEFKAFLLALIEGMSSAEIIAFLSTLDKSLLLAVISKLDLPTLQAIQKQTGIKNSQEFNSLMSKSKNRAKITIYKDMGKAKEHRKKYIASTSEEKGPKPRSSR